MRSVLLAFFLLCRLFLLAERPISYHETLEQKPALTELFTLFGTSSDKPLVQLKEETRALWMQAGKERWEFESRYEEEKEILWPLFAKLDLFDSILASRSHYDFALVHGALLSRVEDRLNFLISEWNRGVRFNQLVFLTGQRPLQPSELAKVGAPFETDMVRWVYERADMPVEMRALPVTFVDASGQNGRRPCTEDTVRTWLSMKPIPGTCLCVSNQPYTCYQDGVIKRLLPDPFTVETIGPQTGSDPSVSILLDTLAKWLNQMDE
ncbi:MAG: hypothetical protein JSS32_10175 [Verrucomicrobia bacterium]|nr:hypothetical protein [Verrucomicrobiota bacterium]